MSFTKSFSGIGALALIGILAASNNVAVADNHTRSENETLLEDVSENPRAYSGQRLRLRGEIDEIHSPRLLSLEEIDNRLIDDIFDEDEVLIVVGSTAGMNEESRLAIGGRVYPYDLNRLERAFAFRVDEGTRRELDRTYSGKAMIIADTVAALR